MANPWDIPPSAPLRAGVRNEDELFLSVGRALSRWEGLEAEMGGIYAALTTDLMSGTLLLQLERSEL
jgi:hypothetical protein